MTTERHYASVQPRLYDIARGLMRVFFHLLTRVCVSLPESLPTRGPAILVVNHLSYFDGPLVVAVMPIRVRPLVAERLKRHIFRPILAVAGAIFVHRGLPDRTALRAVTEVLEDGGVLAIAIEGHRSPDGRMHAAKHGAAYLAARTGAPVIPGAIWGTEQIGPSLLRLRRAEIHLCIGAPIEIRERDVSRLDEPTRQIMSSIAAMLPERYRPQEWD